MSHTSGVLLTGQTTALRTIGGVIAADSATLSDANYPAVGGVLTGAIDCSGYDSIFVGVEIVAGTGPTMAIEALFYDPNAPADAHLSRLLLGAEPGVTVGALASEVTPALTSDNQYAELRVFGHKQVFLRVTAVTNPTSTTSATILGRPGRVRGDRAIALG